MARYIDADELYKKIFPLDVVDKRRYSIVAKAVAEAIDKTPTADVVPRAEWISVEERLPENGEERVAVVLQDNPVTATIGINKIDTDRYLDGSWVRWGKYVTHWMPLPELPKGE